MRCAEHFDKFCKKSLQKVGAIPAFLNCRDGPKKCRYRPKTPIPALFIAAQ